MTQENTYQKKMCVREKNLYTHKYKRKIKNICKRNISHIDTSGNISHSKLRVYQIILPLICNIIHLILYQRSFL